MAITHPINTAGEFETRDPESVFIIRESYFKSRRNDLDIERGGLTMIFVDLHRPLQDYTAALEQAGGNQAQAARALGLSYHQFRYFHQKYKRQG